MPTEPPPTTGNNNFVIDATQLGEALRTMVGAPDLQRLYQAATRTGDTESRARLCGAMVWSGFSAPAAILLVYDTIAAGLFGTPEQSQTINATEAPLPESFWQAFAQVLTGPDGGYDAGSITAAVATLGGATGAGFGELAELVASEHPGADLAARKPVPELLSLEVLQACPQNSLAHDLYCMLVENGYDAEVLDREAIGLAHLSPALRYLNTRILQMHDIWHLVAGYKTTALHEIAISAFQLAQFGHNYSGMFLATVCCRSHLTGGLGFDVLLRVIMEAWQHGRTTAPLMGIEFEDEWHDSVDTIRQRHNITPFAGTFPADLFEQMSRQPLHNSATQN